jgi:hypothetical protein
MMDQPKTPNKAIIGLVVIVLLVVAATAVVVMSGNNAAKQTTDATASSSPEVSASVSPTASTEAAATNSSFKNGTYSATGSYQTPGGQESIGVKVTIADGVITDANVTQEGKTGEAQEYQSKFVSGYKSQVVGKKISDVNLSRVAGSSLTPIGFNDAINDIEKQATA